MIDIPFNFNIVYFREKKNAWVGSECFDTVFINPDIYISLLSGRKWKIQDFKHESSHVLYSLTCLLLCQKTSLYHSLWKRWDDMLGIAFIMFYHAQVPCSSTLINSWKRQRWRDFSSTKTRQGTAYWLLKITWCMYFTWWNSRHRGKPLSVFHRNAPNNGNDQR